MENLIDDTIKKNMQPEDDSRGIIRNRDTSESNYGDLSDASVETTGEAMEKGAPIQPTNLPDKKLGKKSKKAKLKKHRSNDC